MSALIHMELGHGGLCGAFSALLMAYELFVAEYLPRGVSADAIKNLGKKGVPGADAS